MFINITNHPTAMWSMEQMQTAEKLSKDGKIEEIQFPQIDPQISTLQIHDLAYDMLKDIEVKYSDVDINNITIHIMGEMTFVYAFVWLAKAKGYKCIASTTERIVREFEGKKISTFKFIQFREY